MLILYEVFTGLRDLLQDLLYLALREDALDSVRVILDTLRSTQNASRPEGAVILDEGTSVAVLEAAGRMGDLHLALEAWGMMETALVTRVQPLVQQLPRNQVFQTTLNHRQSMWKHKNPR